MISSPSRLMKMIMISCSSFCSVTVFYVANQESPDPNTSHNIEKTRQEREFKIGSLGFADSTEILLASILAVPTEIELCKAQLRRGKMFSKDL
jgi:battenin